MRTFLALMFVASVLALAAAVVNAISGPTAFAIGIIGLIIMIAFTALRPRKR